MLQKSDIEKLDRFTKGLASPDEEKYIISLFSDYEESRELREYVSSEWNEYLKDNQSESYETSYLLDRIYHIIHSRESQREQTLVRKMYRWYSLTAAILLIPVLVLSGIWILKNSFHQEAVIENQVTSNLIAPMGSRISFTLPDGTKGWLNSGSSLEYSIPFGNLRKVTLLGEAWFDVARDEKHPFEISAGDSKIKVLGTQFNVDAYPSEKYVEVSLNEGKVEFSSPHLVSPVVMKPNDRLVYQNDQVNLSVSSASKYAAWIEGKLIFRGDPMGEVARRLERWYNVRVELMDKDLENDVIRGTFQDDSLEEVLRLLSLTSPIRYRIIGRKALEDGSFEKEKVLIFRKKVIK